MKTVLFYVTILVLSLSAEEVSVYGFGGTQKSETPTQKTNEHTPTQNTPTTMLGLQQKVLELEERVSGLTTVIEGVNAQVATQGQKPSSVSSGATNDVLLEKLAAMIDKINSEYVSKQELEAVINSGKIVQSATPKQVNKPTSTPSVNSDAALSNKALYNKGIRAFIDKEYTVGEKCFKQTIEKNYKSAASNFYLGEMKYYTKKYEDAIYYYKKSAGLNDTASYIDTLLLHTAIALEATGKKTQAIAFYENVIANYAAKKTGSIAQSRLKKLQ